MTPEHKAALVAELRRAPYQGKTSDDAFAMLFNGVASSVTVHKPTAFSFSAILGVLSQASLLSILNSPSFPDVRQCVLNQDRAGLGIFAGGFAQAGLISGGEYAALVALLSATTETQQEQFTDPLFSSADCLLHGVEGIPNVFERSDFDAAFTEANS